MDTVADILFTLVWVAGLVGTLLPVVPATLLILAGALLHAVMTGFEPLSWWFLLGLGAVGVAAMLADNVAGAWGARRFGGSRHAAWGALAGGLAGVFLGPLGIIVGPFAGAAIAEAAVARRRPADAIRSGFGAVVGLLGGIGAKLVIHAAMGVVVLRAIL